jgi:hypothetical protein
MKTLTVAGGNLFQIAQLNGIVDPMLTGVVTILVPDIDMNAGGGIAPQ